MMLLSYETAEAAIEAARAQRFGVVAIVGCDRLIRTTGASNLPDTSTWLARDLGFEPSLWALSLIHI